MGRHRDEIARATPPRFSWRRLRRDLQNRFAGRVEDLRQALGLLEHQGYLRQVDMPVPQMGRPPEPDYWVHPDWAVRASGELKHF